MARGNFGPTLAATADEATVRALLDRGHLWASPKLDGFRCLVRGGALASRNLKPVANRHVNESLAEPLLEGMDGELVVGFPTGEGVFNRTSSGVTSFGGRPDFRFHVFDLHDHPGGFEERSRELLVRHAALGPAAGLLVVPVLQYRIGSVADLVDFEERCVSQGYEGVMLRRPDAPYKHGRSTLREGYLLKVKRFEDREAVVLGSEELVRNANEARRGNLGQTERSRHQANMVPAGTLGALVVRDRGPAGAWSDFGIGTGFDQATRDALWAERGTLPGRTVKYRYLPVGTVDRPRFPVFLGFRDGSDL